MLCAFYVNRKMPRRLYRVCVKQYALIAAYLSDLRNGITEPISLFAYIYTYKTGVLAYRGGYLPGVTVPVFPTGATLFQSPRL